MADVSPPHHGSTASGATDRGQLLLIAALGLAVLFVSLALLLNTAIYSENLATRGSDIAGGQDALRWRYAAQTGIADTMRFVNANNNSTYTNLEGAFESGVEAWDDISATHEATAGKVTNVSLLSTTRGKKLEQDDATRNFTNATGQANWELATNTTDSRNFELVVEGTGLTSCGLVSSCFTVTVDNGSHSWQLHFNETLAGNVEVVVEDTTGSQRTCAVVSSFPATYDLHAGEFGGETCRDYQFGGDLQGDYNVSFENGGQLTGTYQVYVTPTTAPVTANFGGGPTIHDALYSATVKLQYHARQIDYVVEYLIEPGGDNE